MLHPQTQGSTPAARTGAAPARPGQVPQTERVRPRSVFLSVRIPWRGAEIDWDGLEQEERRLAGLGFGVALGVDGATRAVLGPERWAELVARTGKLALAQGFVAGASCE